MSTRIVINRRLAVVVLTPLLALLIALIGLAGTATTAEAAPFSTVVPGINTPGIDPLTGKPWWMTKTPSKAARDAGIVAPERYPMLDINEELARLGY